jgi:cytochrome b561
MAHAWWPSPIRADCWSVPSSSRYPLLALSWGVWLVWVRGDNIFGLLQIPAFNPGNGALRQSQKEIHETLVSALLVLAGVHALMALAHHYIRRNGVLRRMMPDRG